MLSCILILVPEQNGMIVSTSNRQGKFQEYWAPPYRSWVAHFPKSFKYCSFFWFFTSFLFVFLFFCTFFLQSSQVPYLSTLIIIFGFFNRFWCKLRYVFLSTIFILFLNFTCTLARGPPKLNTNIFQPVDIEYELRIHVQDIFVKIGWVKYVSNFCPSMSNICPFLGAILDKQFSSIPRATKIILPLSSLCHHEARWWGYN